MAKCRDRQKAAKNKSILQSSSRKISQRARQFRRSHPLSHVRVDASPNASHRYQQIQLPLARRPLTPNISYRHHLGSCDVICSSCHAAHWIQERSYKSTINDPLFFSCCQRGQILLPSFPDAPEPLKSLLLEQTDGTSLSNIHTHIYIFSY